MKRVDKEKQTYEVYFVDFGNSETVGCSDMYLLPEELATVCIAFMVC